MLGIVRNDHYFSGGEGVMIFPLKKSDLKFYEEKKFVQGRCKKSKTNLMHILYGDKCWKQINNLIDSFENTLKTIQTKYHPPFWTFKWLLPYLCCVLCTVCFSVVVFFKRTLSYLNAPAGNTSPPPPNPIISLNYHLIINGR